MKKILIVFGVLTLLLGCKANNQKPEDVDFENQQVIEEERYEYGHGVVDYQFEKWSYNGQDLVFDYFIKNIEKEAEFGLVFLIDGINQTYEVDGEKTSMYKVNMKSNEEKKLSIKLKPEIDSNKKTCNLNAYLILNPSTQIKESKQYIYDHSISSTATINLDLNSHAASDKIKVKSLDVTYDDIPSDILKEHVRDGENMLNTNVNIEYVSSDGNEDNILNADKPIKLRAFGKSGNYRVLVVKDNVITETYDIGIKDKQYSIMTLNVDLENTTNIYFLIVPTDVQDVQDYIMMNQSERYIVK